MFLPSVPWRRPQRGQVLPLVLIGLLLAGLVGAGLVRLAVVESRRSSAQAAADAAALAGAADGEGAARRLAAENGARIVAYEPAGRDVRVVVERAGVRAHARARWVSEPATPDAGDSAAPSGQTGRGGSNVAPSAP